MTDLYGSNPMEQAKIDMIVDTANEIRERCLPVFVTHVEGEAYVSITVNYCIIVISSLHLLPLYFFMYIDCGSINNKMKTLITIIYFKFYGWLCIRNIVIIQISLTLSLAEIIRYMERFSKTYNIYSIVLT